MNNGIIAAVDDNADIRFMISEICKTDNYAVIGCESYRDVKEIMGRKDIDLYIVDYHLPEKDGVEVVRMIRSVNKSVPIIMLTVENDDTVAARVKQAGADDYALKPIKAIDFLSRVNLHIKHSRQARYYTDHSTGVSESTLQQIIKAMSSLSDFADVDTISSCSGIGSKSVYRYLKYMEEHEMLDIFNSYEKLGRPKTFYRLKSTQLHPTTI